MIKVCITAGTRVLLTTSDNPSHPQMPWGVAQVNEIIHLAVLRSIEGPSKNCIETSREHFQYREAGQPLIYSHLLKSIMGFYQQHFWQFRAHEYT